MWVAGPVPCAPSNPPEDLGPSLLLQPGKGEEEEEEDPLEAFMAGLEKEADTATGKSASAAPKSAAMDRGLDEDDHGACHKGSGWRELPSENHSHSPL